MSAFVDEKGRYVGESEYVDDTGRYYVEDFVPHLSWYLVSNPASVAEKVLDRAKFAAKLLSVTASITHRRALEVIACGLDFNNWYAFKKHLSEVTTSAAASEAWREKMSKAFLLLGCNRADFRIPKEHLRRLEAVANKISEITDTPVSVLLDQFCSRLCSAGSWTEVVNRSPLKAIQPLYWFSKTWGHFEESPACFQLGEDLHVLLYGHAPASDDEILHWLKTTITFQPTFVDAALQLSRYYFDIGNASKALAIASFPAAHLISLIPDDYNGEISYWSVENRPFLRLLYVQMEAKEALGDFYGALDLAEDLLDFNPRDGLQVHLQVPRLLKRLGRPDIAQEWTKYIRSAHFFYPVLHDRFLTELVRAPVA